MKRTGTGTSSGMSPPQPQGQPDDRSKIDENRSTAEDPKSTQPKTAPSSASSFSTAVSSHPVPQERKRFSLASVDAARLMTSFSQGRHVISYDSCTGMTSDSTLRDSLNETFYELMVARAAAIESGSGIEGIRLSTSETPFVDPPLTGNEDVDAFVLERTARAVEGNDVGDFYDEDEEANEKASAWQSSSAWRRGLIVLLLTLLFVLLAHLATFIYLRQSPEEFEHPYACKTKNCLQLSEWLQEGVDNKTHPCDDFYHFTCGNYIRDHPMSPVIDKKGFRRMSEAIPFEYARNEGLGALLHRVHDYPLNQILPFYQACIDQDERDRIGFRPFLNLLLQLKLMDPIQAHPMNIARTIVRIYRKVNRRIFFDTYSSKENFIVMNLCQPDKECTQFNQNEYVTSMRQAFTLLKDELKIEDVAEIETIVYLVIRFEAEVIFLESKEATQVFGFPDNMDTFVKMPPVFHRNYIPSQLGFFRFDSYVAALFEHQRDMGNFSIFFNYLLSVAEPEDRLYIVFMEDLLSRTSSYVLLRYFQWILIKHFAMDLTTELLEIMIPIFRAMGQTLDERCFRSMFSKLHVLAAVRYSRELKNLHSLDKKVAEVVDKIWKTLKDLMEGFPVGLVDNFKETFSTFTIVETTIADFEPHMTTFYPGLDMSMNAHFENVIQATSIKAENDLMKIQNIPPFHLWPLGEYSVDEVTITRMQNARETSRFLYIPLGALQQPYMGNDIPLLDLGGFGFWIGAYYLMRYTIDDLLIYHAKERETEEPETIVIHQKLMEMELLPRLECIFDQYRRTMIADDADFQADPTSEKGRVYNLAFFTAVELLLETMDQNPKFRLAGPKKHVLLGLEQYTPEQLFFMAMTRHLCKSYSPARIRQKSQMGILTPGYHINTAFRNSPRFAKVWECSGKRFMNPVRKCKFFQKSIQNSKGSGGDGGANSTS